MTDTPTTPPAGTGSPAIEVRPLERADLDEADRIFRLAFGTFLGLPDPMAFGGDTDMVRTRFEAAPDRALGAYRNDELLGSCFVAHWGSFAFFGPLTVRPDLWDQGVARVLMGETMSIFDRLGVRQSGLFTFPHSPKHVGLYQSYGYWPQALTPLMVKAVSEAPRTGFTALSALSGNARETALAACRDIAGSVYAGLDLTGEIEAVAARGLGETILIERDGRPAGFAVLHTGAGSEAGSGTAYAKFAAVRPGANAETDFTALLAACETLAAGRGLGQVMAGCNMARRRACEILKTSGYRTLVQGVAMLSGAGPGFNRPDCFVLDDWR